MVFSVKFAFFFSSNLGVRPLHTLSDTFQGIPNFFGVFCPLGLLRESVGESVKVTPNRRRRTVNNLYWNR